MKNLLAALALVSSLAAVSHAQKPQTDRDANGLKGPVKVVLIKTATLRNEGARLVEDAPEAVSKETYDADGNLLLEEDLGPRGDVRSKTVYGYADGVRFAERYVPRALSIGILMNAGTPPPPSPPPAGPDLLEKYRYKYDDKGKVVELIVETQRAGQGVKSQKPWQKRTVYKHQGNQTETLYYKVGEHEPSSRRLATFDARGNLLEETFFGPQGGADPSKHSYSDYEFDARGNWIKRVVSLWVKKEGKLRPEPQKVEYRTIEYF